jgi:F-type H+-transporting ATPase subunit gamma
MSVQIKEVKRRIGTVRQVRRVTSTLRQVAAARVQQLRIRIDHSRLYLEQLHRLLGITAGSVSLRHHALLRASSAGRPCLVIFGADRGLCGGFVGGLIEAAQARAERSGWSDFTTMTVGRVTSRRARRQGFVLQREFRQPELMNRDRRGDPAAQRVPGLQNILDATVNGFLRGEYREVHLVYARFETLLRQRPVVVPFLPIGLPSGAGGSQATVFDPSPDEILRSLSSEFLNQCLFHAAVSSVGSENAARQMAMQRATDNASTMLGELTTSFRRLRQEGITTEMLELFGGEINA